MVQLDVSTGIISDSYMKFISLERKIPIYFKSLPLRIGVITFLMSMLTYQIVGLWPDPYAIGKFFMMLLTITTGIGVIRRLLSISERGAISVRSEQYPIG
jgi:hypothetical protein